MLIPRLRSDREAFPAAAATLGVGILEHEAGREVVLAPVHHRSDQVEDRPAVDVEGAGAAVPVDAVVVDGREGVRGRRAGFVRAGFARDNGLVRVPESTAVGVAGVDV